MHWKSRGTVERTPLKLLERQLCDGGREFRFLPPRSTAKYQPLDLGLIAHSKIRYRSILLRCVILMIEARAAGRINFTEDTGTGKVGDT